ncbi:MAG TPA: hypothetical protein VLD62_08950 [Acidimicrobiia bacterium]|nr:hypothetical protein [Acidimicrobiia bacterium]
MTLSSILLWFHLVGMAVWIGGTITVGAIVPALRTSGASSEQLRAMARAFGRASWTALAVLVVTGIWQMVRAEDGAISEVAFGIKLMLVGVAGSLALLHQMTARTASPATRGIVQGLILLASLGALAAAVAL